MKISVAWQWQDSINEISLTVAEDATVGDALAQLKNMPTTSLVNALGTRAGIGVWGKVLTTNDEQTRVLRENDRIEVYQPLKADPKLARRQRVETKKQAEKRTR